MEAASLKEGLESSELLGKMGVWWTPGTGVSRAWIPGRMVERPHVRGVISEREGRDSLFPHSGPWTPPPLLNAMPGSESPAYPPPQQRLAVLCCQVVS